MVEKTFFYRTVPAHLALTLLILTLLVSSMKWSLFHCDLNSITIPTLTLEWQTEKPKVQVNNKSQKEGSSKAPCELKEMTVTPESRSGSRLTLKYNHL